jgi:serine/threonine-protein kinase
MSPEQLTTPRDVDARTDIWSLGVILYRLLTGRVPFDADTIVLLCSVILHGDPLPLREMRADVPAGLEAIVAKCLEKDRARRFANVGELARALLEYAPDRSRVSVERVLHLTATQPAAAETVPGKRVHRSSAPELTPLTPVIETNSSWGQTASGARRRSRRGTWFVLAAVLLGGTAFGAWRLNLLLGQGRPDATASSPVPPPQEPPRSEPHVAPIPATQPVASLTPQPSPPSAQSVPPGTAKTPSPPEAGVGAPFRGLAKPGPRRTVPSPASTSTGHKSTEPGSGNWEDQRK